MRENVTRTFGPFYGHFQLICGRDVECTCEIFKVPICIARGEVLSCPASD